jgi:hypothetical protein
MRLATILLLLPALAVAEDQKPLIDIAKGWFEQAKSYIPTAVPSISPVDAGAAVVAANKVEKININNYKRKLGPSPDGPTEWLIMVSGKNESCFGGCDSANLKWNVSALSCARVCDSVTATDGLLGVRTSSVRCRASTSSRLPRLRQRTSPLRRLGRRDALALVLQSSPSNTWRNGSSTRRGFRTDTPTHRTHQWHNCLSNGLCQTLY